MVAINDDAEGMFIYLCGAVPLRLIEKKGQISLFILLGFVVLIFVGLLMYVKNASDEKKMETAVVSTLQNNDVAEQVRARVQDCLSKESVESIKMFGLMGGNYDLSNPIWYEERGEIRVAYGVKQSFKLIPTKEQAEKAIAEEIQRRLSGCIDMARFGAAVSARSDPKVRVDIVAGQTMVQLSYHIVIGTKSISSFKEEYNLDLQDVLLVAYEITSKLPGYNFGEHDYSCNKIMACAEGPRFVRIVEYNAYADQVSFVFQFATDVDPGDQCSNTERYEIGAC